MRIVDLTSRSDNRYGDTCNICDAAIAALFNQIKTLVHTRFIVSLMYPSHGVTILSFYTDHLL